ncbi:hypothetical protein MSS4_04647 [Mycobacterium marinum]|uniref:hypothetical protein n=1 Tax=Mycobacterium marinum TaxID=1781 RepID=UPI000E3C1A05|nr:hypothetical protein [Mycobacterium marinum]RFZ42682.1 hypothetical protein MSS4_04647 [Mycobacterium marinum]
MDLIPERCTAGELFRRRGDKFLRIDGDSDDPQTWHQVKDIRDNWGDINSVAVSFHDSADEKLYNGDELVEFAVYRND